MINTSASLICSSSAVNSIFFKSLSVAVLVSARMNLELKIFYTEKIELKNSLLNSKQLLSKKIWVGVMIQKANITIKIDKAQSK